LFKIAEKLDPRSENKEERLCILLLRLHMGNMVFCRAFSAVSEKHYDVAIRLLAYVEQFSVGNSEALMTSLGNPAGDMRFRKLPVPMSSPYTYNAGPSLLCSTWMSVSTSLWPKLSRSLPWRTRCF
jgi:hypothetical protein